MIAIIARGAVSGLGEQDAASGVGADGEAARVSIKRDDELAQGGLARPLASRVSLSGTEDRATAILKKSLSLFFVELDRARPSWRNERVGIALATSSGGMRSAEAYLKHFPHMNRFRNRRQPAQRTSRPWSTRSRKPAFHFRQRRWF